jgi:excisionase family DNA binding protein
MEGKGTATAARKLLPPLLSIREVADYFHVTPSAIWMRIYRGKLPYTKIGGRLYVREDELQRLVDTESHGTRPVRRKRGKR